MKKLSSCSKPPAKNLPIEWIETVRVIVQRDGHAVRAGHGPSILAQSINDGIFRPINLPGDTTIFEERSERDRVLLMLQSASPLCELPPVPEDKH